MSNCVASFTDAWIETTRSPKSMFIGKVASFTDAWIETYFYTANLQRDLSHLLQMRGLKQLFSKIAGYPYRRIFYRCVD